MANFMLYIFYHKKIPTVLVYTGKERLDSEILKVLFTISLENMQYLAINLTKEVENVYTKNYKIPKERT